MKDKLVKMFEQAEAILKDIEALEGKAAAAATDEERAAVQKEIDGKTTEYDRLETRIESGKAQIERAEKIKGMRAGIKPDTKDIDLADAEDTADGKVRVTESEATRKEQLFLDYVCGKAVTEFSDNERDAMHPKCQKFDEGKSGFVVPSHLLSLMMGKSVGRRLAMFGKTVTPFKSNVSTQGGALFDDEFIAELQSLAPEPTHLLSRVTVIPTATGTFKAPVLTQTDANEYGGMTFDWIEEAAEKPETKPSLRQETVTCHELAGYTQLSDTSIRRSQIGLVSLLSTLYRDGLNDVIDTAIMSGDGDGKPLGITETAGIRTVGRQTNGAVDVTDLINLEHEIRANHRDRCLYLIQDQALKGIKIADLAREWRVLEGGRLNTYPYEPTHRQADLGDDGDVIFGDPSAYWMGMEQEIVVRSAPIIQTNVTEFAVFTVVGGKLIHPRAMVILVGQGS